jgi:hypothetical protein
MFALSMAPSGKKTVFSPQVYADTMDEAATN